MSSGARSPVWLRTLWERRKTETASRVAQAVNKLRADGSNVTYSSICSMVRATDGISISPNTIKRNDGAYEIYLASRRPAQKCLPEPLLTQILTAADPEGKQALRSRIVRLRRETKDMLIARLIRLEGTVTQQKAAENALRNEVIRLSVTACTPK